jgi:signal transduction histidine kinase
MNIQIILATVIITTFLTTLFVVALNYKNSNKSIHKLNFRNVATQLLALTIWVTILGNILLDSQNIIKIEIGIILFIVSVVIGVFLIKSLAEELEYQELVNELIRRLRENNKKLQVLDEQKTEFVSLASHQLRGPLSVIHGYISMILDGDYGEITDDMKEPLERTLRSSRALSFLINDYLDVAQIEKGEMEYIIADLDLDKFLSNLVSEFEIVAKKNGLNFTFTNHTENIILRADENKIRQVVSNIIDNAIKYTKKGSVDINVKKYNDDVIISVKDTGIGLEKNQTHDVFNKFARADQAVKMNVIGNGLGLFVAKVMVEAHNGKIWVESDGIGKGSTFYISLPIAKKD